MTFDTKFRGGSIAKSIDSFGEKLLANIDSSRENNRSMFGGFLKILRRFNFQYFVLVPLLDRINDSDS